MPYSSVEFMPCGGTALSHYHKKKILLTLLEVCCDNCNSENMNWWSFFQMGFCFTGMGSSLYQFNYNHHVSMY